MMSSPARLIELCLLAAVGLAQAPGPAAAEPSDARDHGSYAYLASGGSITMSGDIEDAARARGFKQGNGPLLWFREAGREYIVRDPDTLAQLEAVWKPGRELDAQESRLDHQHDGLEHKHDQLDARRDALESRRDALSDRESELAERESDESTSAASRAAIARQRRDLQQQKQSLAGELRALDQPMKELRAQMDAIQRLLDVLRQRQKLASAREDTEARALFRRAIAAGTARPIK